MQLIRDKNRFGIISKEKKLNIFCISKSLKKMKVCHNMNFNVFSPGIILHLTVHYISNNLLYLQMSLKKIAHLAILGGVILKS